MKILCGDDQRQCGLFSLSLTMMHLKLKKVEILSYFFICHPEQAEQYRSLLSEFLKTKWGGANENKAPFTEERTEGFVPISI